MDDWEEGDTGDEPWPLSSPSQTRKWSTGRWPGGTLPPCTRRQGATKDPAGPNPNFLHKHTRPSFTVKNECIFKEELEVEIQTINDKPFRGSITRQEA
jgi:hypothetical protein